MNREIVTVSMFRTPRDARQREFKIFDIKSANIFMNEGLKNGNSYKIPDLSNPDMYYSLYKKSDEVSISHTKYGELAVEILENDDVDKKIYMARKSINNHFFNRGDK